jgi:FlaA1/EpsC-like NDP-sugar epimerase
MRLHGGDCFPRRVGLSFLLSHTPFDFIIRYIMDSLFLGVADACIAARLGQLAHVQKQRRIRFAWSGLGSIAATFLLVTSLLFIFKLSDFYSRGTLILQFLSCSIIVFAVRLGMYNGFQAAAAVGLVRRFRVVLIGNRNDCAQYARQLRKSGEAFRSSSVRLRGRPRLARQIPSSDRFPRASSSSAG